MTRAETAAAGERPPHAEAPEAVLRRLDVDPAHGLSRAEARRRRRRFGANRLRQRRRKSAWRILLAQFESIIVWLLAGAAALSFQFARWSEGAAIVIVLAINAAIGFFTEIRAVRSMEALRRMARVTTRVRRDGSVREVPAETLVPGDIVLLEGGDILSADLRLVEAANLACDESVLTGESMPVGKQTTALEADVPLAERGNMAFKGTAVTRGSAEGVVVATGMATELGRISELVEEAEPEASPLEKRLDHLARQLVWVTLVLAAAIAGLGIAAGQDLLLMVETGIALAVAAVPEGLPIVATVALARGMWRMAQRNALIERLAATETLGATTVICTDKTGTLTESRMRVGRLGLASGPVDVGWQDGAAEFRQDDAAIDPSQEGVLRRAARAAVLCNNATLPAADAGSQAGAVGDPMEVALLRLGRAAGLERPALLDDLPELREEAFDPARKMMATLHRSDGETLVAVKGAPEAVIGACTSVAGGDGEQALDADGRGHWQEAATALAEQGLRVLALADKSATGEVEDPYHDLTLLALAGLQDPARQDVPAAIAACREAGIRVVMVTGDHAVTARSIAAAVGLEAEPEQVLQGEAVRPPERLSQEERARLLAARVFARVAPEQKLNLVALYQDAGEVVAMTGDGVNDAPALKKADIGVAMGRRGSQVAREAADMVLRDDAFTSIVAAVAQGRVIFGNIRKFVVYLLSCNLSEIFVVSAATVAGLPLPLLPLQILYLNLVTDVFPAFALGVGEGESGVMRRPPRDPREAILGRRRWAAIAGYGGAITVATMAAYVFALGQPGLTNADAVTVAFLTLAFAQLWHVLNMRETDSRLAVNEVTRNPFVWGAIMLCIGLLLAAVYLPVLSDVLALRGLSWRSWLLVMLASLAPLVAGQAAKLAIGAARRRAA